MNINQLNEVLKNNNISINDVMRIAKKFEEKDLNNEHELRAVIQDLGKLLGKEFDTSQENQMINMVKNRNVKM